MNKEELKKELEEFEQKTKTMEELIEELREKDSDLLAVVEDNEMIVMVCAMKLIEIFSRFFGVDSKKVNIKTK